MDTDKINNADMHEAFRATYKLVDAVQTEPAHAQVLAAALFYLEVCHGHRVDGAAVMTAAANLVAAAQQTDAVAAFRALRLYIKNELVTP